MGEGLGIESKEYSINVEELMSVIGSTRNVISRMVGESNSDEILQDAAHQVVELAKSGEKIRSIRALVNTIARRRAVDFCRKHSRCALVPRIVENACNPWKYVDTVLDIEQIIPKVSIKVATILNQILVVNGREAVKMGHGRMSILGSSILTTEEVNNLVEEQEEDKNGRSEERDLLSTWVPDDRFVIIVDKSIKESSIEDFEDDLRKIALLGGYGHIDVVTPMGSFKRYVLSDRKVSAHNCKMVTIENKTKAVDSNQPTLF
jgi:hypothetical protein